MDSVMPLQTDANMSTLDDATTSTEVLRVTADFGLPSLIRYLFPPGFS